MLTTKQLCEALGISQAKFSLAVTKWNKENAENPIVPDSDAMGSRKNGRGWLTERVENLRAQLFAKRVKNV